MIRALLAALLALAALVGRGPAPAVAKEAPPAAAQPARQVGGYMDLGLLISSSRFGYGYAYAPTIVREGDTWHMFFCSYGRPGIWDHVRYATSRDGRRWSDPVVALEGTDEAGERAACDPSVVRYRAPGDPAPYWYMFYSGNAPGLQTVMFVARAERIEGPYAKWTKRRTWEVGAPDPAIIIRPRAPTPDGGGFYGAGQQSVVVDHDRLVGWHTDDTTCPASCWKLIRTTTRDPTSWPAGEATNAAGTASVDIKRDGAGFVMVSIDASHSATATLALRRSADGLTWSGPEIVCDATCFPHFTHNAGIGGDATGGLLPGPLLVVYGGPADRDPACGSCWGKWDLFGGRIGWRPK